MEFNRIFLVEKFMKMVESGYQPSEEEVKRVSEVLGQPTKKLDVLKKTYTNVFTRYIEKRCSDLGDGRSVCIYTLSPRATFKPIPVLMHATGTIILFEDGEPKKVLAFPITKALSYAKGQGVEEETHGDYVPKEVSIRVDGWQLTAYYNDALNRWIFATRYVLHNMYFERGKLIVEDFASISNPYVYVADALANELGLYEKLKGFEGWTFTFVLEGPEPAITRPPYPLGSDYRSYRLRLVMARDPQGKLYSYTESKKVIDWPSVDLIEPKKLRDLYEDVRKSLTVRSYIAYVPTDDPVNPLLVELESDYYPDAMMVKYLYDAKSFAVLASEGLDQQAVELLDRDDVKSRCLYVAKAIRDAEAKLRKAAELGKAEEVSRALSSKLAELGIKIESKEIEKALSQANVKRIVKKIFSLVLEGKSLVQPLEETINSILKSIDDVIPS